MATQATTQSLGTYQQDLGYEYPYAGLANVLPSIALGMAGKKAKNQEALAKVMPAWASQGMVGPTTGPGDFTYGGMGMQINPTTGAEPDWSNINQMLNARKEALNQGLIPMDSRASLNWLLGQQNSLNPMNATNALLTGKAQGGQDLFGAPDRTAEFLNKLTSNPQMMEEYTNRGKAQKEMLNQKKMQQELFSQKSPIPVVTDAEWGALDKEQRRLLMKELGLPYEG